MKPSQTLARAIVLAGDSPILSTNGNLAKVLLSIVAVSQANESKIARIDPISLKTGQ